MGLFYKLCGQNPNTRDGVVMATSILGILVNTALALVKILIGVFASSIAIISEGINNATDSASSLLAIVGTKLSHKKPSKKHPFGYGRIEYLTSLTISLIILFTGLQFLRDCVYRIFNPSELKISYLILAILGLSAVVKLFLGAYTVRMGRKVDSGALVAVGTECKNDCIVSAVTIISAIIFLLFGVSVDAYAGAITSVFILKAGFDVLKETLDSLLGNPPDKKLADRLYREIRNTPGVLNAADMMLHNYGPDAYSGSVNIEMDHTKTVGELYETIHALQLRIMHQYGVTMVFGIYAVDTERGDSKKMRAAISSFLKDKKHAKSFHALYVSAESKKIFCDIVVDYEMADWEDLRGEFLDFMAGIYPDYSVELVIETEYV